MFGVGSRHTRSRSRGKRQGRANARPEQAKRNVASHPPQTIRNIGMAPSFFTKSALRARAPSQPGRRPACLRTAQARDAHAGPSGLGETRDLLCRPKADPSPGQRRGQKKHGVRSQQASKGRFRKEAAPARSIPWKCDPVRCPLFPWSPPSVPLAIPAYEFAPNFAPSLFGEYRSSRLRRCRLDAIRGAVVGEANTSDRAPRARRT